MFFFCEHATGVVRYLQVIGQHLLELNSDRQARSFECVELVAQ